MNNKKIVTIIAACVLGVTAFAQVGESRSGLRIGVTSGLSLNSIDFDPTVKQRSHTGLNCGIALKYVCEKYFKTLCSLQAELNYARLGWNEDILSYSGSKLPDTYQRHMNYIQLPLLANLGWGRETKGMMFYIVAGPQVGYCISESSQRSEQWTVDAAGNPDRPNNMYEQYNLEIKNRLDYGITAGAGLELNTSHLGHFTLEARYYYGLGDVFGNSKKDVFSRSANNTVTVKLGYYIDVTK